MRNAERVDYPTILEFPPARLFGYSKESTVAEKFEAVIQLGSINSRMKDFYDIWLLSRQFDFDGALLSRAIQEAFSNRGTEVPLRPLAFEDSFAELAEKKTQWRGFLKTPDFHASPWRNQDPHDIRAGYAQEGAAKI